MLPLALKNLSRRPLRSLLTVLGLAGAVAFLATLLAFTEGYQKGMRKELDATGMQMMLVPLGCPYDAAAQILKGKTLETTLPEAVLKRAQADANVAVAAPIFAAALPRPELHRTDLWVGIDAQARTIHPWWHLAEGTFPTKPDDVLLGSEAAVTELRHRGDRLYSPETKATFRVCGVLARSGTADDSEFFLTLGTAQRLFHKEGKLTGIALLLREPSRISETAVRLQTIPGAQTVTVTEMLGVFLNLMVSARTLTLAIALVAIVVGGLTVFNTMLSSVLERTRELGVLRAVGFSRLSLLGLMLLESLLLSFAAGIIGLAVAAVFGHQAEGMARSVLPLAPTTALPSVTFQAVLLCCMAMGGIGMVAGAYPAWRAANLSPVSAMRKGI